MIMTQPRGLMMKTFALLAVAVCMLSATQAAVINKSIKRTVDLTKHVVRIQTDFEFVDAEQDTNEYVVAFPHEINRHLSHVSAKCGKNPCEVVEAPTSTKEVAQYAVVLTNNVAKGEVGTIKLTAYFTRILTPFPEEISQNEDQLVIFEDVHLVPSPYVTGTQTTKVKLPSGNVESFTDIAPVSRKGSMITYGPYTNVQPFTDAKNLRVHFKNNSPFVTISKLTREIEVSMWGRVSVEEVYDLVHTGAKLKGSFSRLDYSIHGQRGASFHELQARLPKEAVNVYYRDQIGNVSSSRLRPTSTSQELMLKSRFPIFGGWKNQWYMGYSVPTHTVLRRSGDKFKLEMDFSTSIEKAAVDDLTLKIILPEGSTNVQVNFPFKVDSITETKRQTYLDTPLVGRPVVIIEKKNIIAAHNVPFEVTFEFPQMFMLHEPLLLVSGFLAFFVFCMIIVRLDFSLVKKPVQGQKKKKE